MQKLHFLQKITIFFVLHAKPRKNGRPARFAPGGRSGFAYLI
jgi:hypothetical protein